MFSLNAKSMFPVLSSQSMFPVAKRAMPQQAVPRQAITRRSQPRFQPRFQADAQTGSPADAPASSQPLVIPCTHPIHSRVSPWLTPMAYAVLRQTVIPSFFGTVTVRGQEHLPRTGPVILAPTHRSRWDSMIVPYATGRHVTGRDLRFMVTADEMNGLQGWLIRQLGGFPVNPRQPAIASLRFGVEILKNREMMVIFPEGAIFRDRQVHPLRPGLARLAIQAETTNPGLGIQIVPIDLHYCDPIPTWGTDVNVTIGQPLSVSDYCHPVDLSTHGDRATANETGSSDNCTKKGGAKGKAKQLSADLAQSLMQIVAQ